LTGSNTSSKNPASRIEGWILDLYPKNGCMVVWLKTREGRAVRLVDVWQQCFYVAGDYSDLINLADQLHIDGMRFEEKFTKPEDNEPSTVLKVPVQSVREAERLAEKVLAHAHYGRYELYNVDVKPSQLYMYEKDIYPFGHVEAAADQNVIHWKLDDSLESVDYETPPLQEVTLSVNIQKQKRLPAQTDPIEAITITSRNEAHCFDEGNERQKLLWLVETLKALDPDVIYTPKGDDLFFPYLACRAAVNGIEDQLILGREQSPLRTSLGKGQTYVSYGRVYYRPMPTRLLGRIHIDYENSMLYGDCGLPGIIEVARLCRIPAQRVSNTTIGTSMTSAQLYEAAHLGVLIPWRKTNTEELKTASELLIADRGGFYYEPVVGLHESIGEIDFTSLYPMIMLTKNLSGETVRCKCCPDSKKRVPELGYNICEKKIGIVPRSLKLLLEKRQQYKELKQTTADPELRSVYEMRQAALKWILVCCLSYDSIVPVMVKGQLRTVRIGELIDGIVGDEEGVFDCNEGIYAVGLGEDLRCKYTRVRRLIKTRAPERMLDILMDNGRRTCTTSNHEFYVLNRGGLRVRKADQLKVGDLIPVCKTIPDPPKIINEINLIETLQSKLDHSEIDSWRIKGECLKSAIWQKRKLFCQMGLPHENVYFWYKNGIIPLRHFRLLSIPVEKHRELVIGRGRIKGGRITWIPSIIPVDRDLGFFLGLFIADGSASRSYLRFDIGQDESELLRYLRKTAWKLFRLRPHIYKEKKAKMYVAQINCIALVRVLEQVLNVGGSADRGKLTVPTCILNANSAAISGFISGLIAGDGSVSKTRNFVSISTSSESFLKDISYLLLRARLQHSLHRSLRKPSDLYRLDIVDAAGFTQLKQLGFLKKAHEQRITAMLRKTCAQECHHISYELVPVIHSNMRMLARRLRTIRDPRIDILERTCPTRASRMLRKLRVRNAHKLYPAEYDFLEKVASADVGFVSVKEIKEIRPSSNFVYCFELEDALPGFFAGNGAVFTHNSFGYLGFKNARFGRIDAHVATCAFARKILKETVHLAESRGFRLIHGIVDSLWLKKEGATEEDYLKLRVEIEATTRLPVSFEGIYRWIVFLPSKTHQSIPVLNRYYGTFRNGKIKDRGIATRRRDTPPVIDQCIRETLRVLAEAKNAEEFYARLPSAYKVVERYIHLLRSGAVPLEELAIRKHLSQNPDEYRHRVLQAVAARQLAKEGVKPNAGESVSYIITNNRSKFPSRRILAMELCESCRSYDAEAYVDLLLSAVETMLMPFGLGQSIT